MDDYIQTAEPVGSRTVSKRKGVGFSAATIRNEMADLEEMGYLEQPHTSAGRIPSHLGYRYYVDHLLSPLRPRMSDIQKLKRLFTIQRDELEQVFQETAAILSKLTQYTTVILGPMVYEDRLRHLQVVSLSENNAVVVIVTDAGHVEKKRFTVPEKISLSSIEKLVNLLNHRLAGVPLYRLKQTVTRSCRMSWLVMWTNTSTSSPSSTTSSTGNRRNESISAGRPISSTSRNSAMWRK